ncbi:eukaryotic translation initiation factor 4B-like isoform X2 [Oncorhynchus masou masou]|uniref:eukaryotic translation initiation factor 4B-like isoform X2 n=1 Tax=Oncorhynchus masou masou TaxID=90313 RepID=UPI0031841896
MAAAAKKKGNKKGKTLTLTDFLAEDSRSGGNAPPPQPSYAKSTSWADETDDLEGDVSTSWHTGEDSYRAPAIDRNILPTAPRSAREPNVDRSRLPRSPPYTAFLGNLPYDVSEESIKDFFRGLAISAVRLPREPSNPERLKGFGYAEFDDVDSLLRALTLNEENLGNRRIRVDIADQSNDKEGRDNGQMGGRDRMGRMGDMAGPDKTDSDDWRARPTADADDGPPKREESAFGSRDRYGDRDGLRRDDRGFGDRGGDRDRGFGGRDRYDDRGGENGGETIAQNLTDRHQSRPAFGSRRDRDDGGRRAFGSGYRRDDDDQSGGGGGSRYGARDRYGGDREGRYERQDEGREERGGPTERPKLVLKPRSMAKEEQPAGSGGAPPAAPAAARSSSRASIFGAAKPVDTAAKEREVEEKLQRQLEEDQSKGFDRKPRNRDRDPSWRNEEPPSERSRTGSESSHPGSTSGGRASRRRESERSVENEVFSGKEDDPPSPVARPSSANSSTFSSKEPLKVMPTLPPKENAWAKRPALSTGSSEGCAPISTSDTAPPKLRKSKRRGRDSRPAPEPKKYEESPTLKFCSASKYAVLLMDREQGDDAENGVE